MTMKRKRRVRREAMERTELSRDATKLFRDLQYLGGKDRNDNVLYIYISRKNHGHRYVSEPVSEVHLTS